mmetsp:Transcript_21162/g.47470  ORF Transcript_21162/g.47470 Transcript_21162/m.47470 type:complete len:242 (-) Transcript_21162:598-1323(-)
MRVRLPEYVARRVREPARGHLAATRAPRLKDFEELLLHCSIFAFLAALLVDANKRASMRARGRPEQPAVLVRLPPLDDVGEGDAPVLGIDRFVPPASSLVDDRLVLVDAVTDLHGPHLLFGRVRLLLTRAASALDAVRLGLGLAQPFAALPLSNLCLLALLAAGGSGCRFGAQLINWSTRDGNTDRDPAVGRNGERHGDVRRRRRRPWRRRLEDLGLGARRVAHHLMHPKRGGPTKRARAP